MAFAWVSVARNRLTAKSLVVQAFGLVFALFTSRTGTLNGSPATTTSYFHHDHLGSLVAITDETGAVTERLAYDPWGKRRNTNGVADVMDSIVGFNTDRGFTMHEHLDEIGIVHMNGRIYDPLIGRFMSADPFIQAPGNLQSYNRYAYVMNNPLAFTDPSGYFSFRSFFRAVVVVVVAVHAPQLLATYGFAGATAATATIVNAAVTGAVIGTINTGTLQGAVQGAVSGALFAAAGFAGTGEGISAKVASESTARYIAHAAAGCVSAEVGGGKCGEGAVAAVFGKYTTNAIGDSNILSGDIAKGVASAVAGGVGSVIGGGKFENGATTAAYGYLFNYMSCPTGEAACRAHNQKERQQMKEMEGRMFVNNLTPLSEQQRQENLGFVVDAVKLGAQLYPNGRIAVAGVDSATIVYHAIQENARSAWNTTAGMAGELLVNVSTRGGPVANEIKERSAAAFGFVFGKIFEASCSGESCK